MAYQVIIVKQNQCYDVSDIAGNISWNDNIDSLGMEFCFSVAVSDEKYFTKFVIEVGDMVLFRKEYEIFRGIIVSKTISETTEQNFKAYDFCWYFNKSKIIKQFNGINASRAIQQLCDELNIKVGEIASMRSNIKHIYYDKTVADIIEDILEQETAETAKSYIKEMRGDSFYIFEKGSIVIKPMFKPAVNIAAFPVTNEIGNFNRVCSIEEMKNAVKIVSGSEKSVRILGEAKDEQNIQKYGLLQEIETIDEKEFNKAQNIAQNKLKQYNKIDETISVDLLGDDSTRAGRILTINDEKTEILGDFLITSCNHTFSKGIHTMTLELERI